MADIRSIHHRRRWYYVLWCCLLLGALGAWALWLIPGQRGEGKLGIRILLRDAPEGTVAQLWSGRAGAWKPAAETFGGEVQQAEGGWWNFPPHTIPIARRRWFQFIHPSTSNQVVVRFTAPGGIRKYARMNLTADLNAGFVKEGRTAGYEIRVKWIAISDSDAFPTGIL